MSYGLLHATTENWPEIGEKKNIHTRDVQKIGPQLGISPISGHFWPKIGLGLGWGLKIFKNCGQGWGWGCKIKENCG